MLCGIVVKTSVFHPELEGRVADESGFARIGGHLHEPMTESRSAALLLSEQAAVIEKPTNFYQVIAERNAFALKPDQPSDPAVSTTPPTEDLSLTGLCSLYSVRCALFTVTDPGKPPTYFKLAEGEQNGWLEVLSVDVENGTVKALLKKPVMRIRNAGVEVLISVEAKNH